MYKMMDGSRCRCPHHIVGKILAILMWISAIVFFWSSWKFEMVWGYEASYYFQSVVVLGLLLLVTGKVCKCCGGMMCKHGESETCEHCK